MAASPMMQAPMTSTARACQRCAACVSAAASAKAQLLAKVRGAHTPFAQALQRLGAVALGEALAVRADQQAVVPVDGRRQAQQRLQQSLHVGGLEEVAAADHVADPL